MIFYAFSLWAFVWFVLYKLNIIKLNPSILYIFLVIPISYLYINTLIKRKNDLDKLCLFILFTISDVFPILYLIVYKEIKLEIESFIVSLILVLVYLLYIKYKKIDINELYTKYLLKEKYL